MARARCLKMQTSEVSTFSRTVGFHSCIASIGSVIHSFHGQHLVESRKHLNFVNKYIHFNVGEENNSVVFLGISPTNSFCSW